MRRLFLFAAAAAAHHRRFFARSVSCRKTDAPCREIRVLARRSSVRKVPLGIRVQPHPQTRRCQQEDVTQATILSRQFMKIHLVSLEDGITAIGFRRMAAFIEQINPNTRVFYVGTRRYLSLSKLIWRTMGEARSFGREEIDEIAEDLAGADLVAFSSMTGYANLTKALASRIREINPRAYVMWGGIHPIIYPENAIKSDVDAICTGEDEFAFSEFH